MRRWESFLLACVKVAEDNDLSLGPFGPLVAVQPSLAGNPDVDPSWLGSEEARRAGPPSETTQADPSSLDVLDNLWTALTDIKVFS